MMYENMLSAHYVNPKDHIAAMKKQMLGETSIHFHEFFEIEIVLDGSGRQMLNGSEYELQRGSVYLLTPTDFHKVKADPSLELINIMFDRSIIQKQLFTSLLCKQKNLVFNLDEKQLERLVFLTEMLMEEKERLDVNTKLCLESLLNCLLVQIMRGVNTARNDDPQKEKDFINKAIDYLYINFRENPPLSKLAHICGYSPNYFSKLFAKLMGKGYNDFLNSLKVSHAKILLSSSDITVSEIAFQCGFTSLSNFYRVFRMQVGITPMEYRTNLC